MPGTRSGRFFRRVLRVVFLLLFLGVTGLGVFEATTSHFQSRYFTEQAALIRHRLEAGRSTAIVFPEHGPRDERLGYVGLGALADTLTGQGFRIVSQARSSPELLAWAARGVGPIYEEKTQAGLEVEDRDGRVLYSARYPRQVFTSFDSIPEVVVNTLLFVENRELLQTRYPYRNPAVEWDRLAKAALEELLRQVQPARNVAGGSTLATQIEKFRHAPGGWTATPMDKIRQMVAASLRAYQQGRETLPVRRDIFLDYINAIPLAAAPGYGEVDGLGDGLAAWYGADLTEVSRLLQNAGARVGEGGGGSGQTEAAAGSGSGRSQAAVALPAVAGGAPTRGEIGPVAARGLAYRQVLSLVLAQRRPTYYLLQDRDALASLTDSYLRILAEAGVIDGELRDAALAAGHPELTGSGELGGRPIAPRALRASPPASSAETKTAVSIRSQLVSLLDRNDLYELDRLDLRVASSIDSAAQRGIVSLFARLKDPEFAREAKLLEARMLQADELESVVYSFTLYERVPGGNLLRVQADNYPGALNLNESARLELGSTAKLRTLTSYLEIIAEVYGKHAGSGVDSLRALEIHPKDQLSRFVVQRLLSRPETTLEEILEAAMERPYSANPQEGFFTGGGLHHFANFDDKHDNQVMSVREGFRNSVNLVFIRMMRDVIHHYTYRGTGPAVRFLEDTGDTLRQVYLERFADREGSEFLRRFAKTYRPLSPVEREETFLDGVRKTPRALAAAFRALQPEAPPEELEAFLRTRIPNAVLGDGTVARLYRECALDSLGLEDAGYVARVHPLELWLVRYLREHPEAELQEILDASREERRQVYTWLYRTKRKNAQDERIRQLFEVEAFLELQRSWARLGYPFESLVPSYATSIGSSGDRAAALADLVGIILADGVRQANMRVLGLSFGEGTPYETNLRRMPQEGVQVMNPAVARTLRQELVGVVEQGTARRAYESVKLPDGTILPVGGKTGTGDNRIKVYGAGGQLVQSKVMNRTASFVFLVGDRFYGTIVAYVPGAKAQNYAFTSALPVQIFATFAKTLTPLFAAPISTEIGLPPAVAAPEDAKADALDPAETPAPVAPPARG